MRSEERGVRRRGAAASPRCRARRIIIAPVGRITVLATRNSQLATNLRRFE